MRLLSIMLFALICQSTSAQQFDWHRFSISDRPAFLILPGESVRRSPMPWIMYAPAFDRSLPNEDHEGWMFKRFLNAGIAIAGVDVGESYGSPTGQAVYDALHKHLTTSEWKCSPKAGLLARSRGGLMLYNWAAGNPEKVACIGGIYPVCDLSSYPGLSRACSAFGMTEEELLTSLDQHNPVARLAPLAAARVPIFHIHGDIDKVVPLSANSGAVAVRYRKLGGSMELIVPRGQGHNMWPGFFQCGPLTRFLIDNLSDSSSVVPTPVAHWRMDEKTGETADDSAGGHHGKFIGTRPVAGKQDGGRLFDRSQGEHVQIEYSKDFELSTFTVAAWVHLTRPPTYSGILGTRFGSEYTFDMKVNDAKVHGDIGNGTEWLETKVNFYAADSGSNEQGGDLSLNRWYHVAYVIDDEEKECRLYLDADLKKTIPFVGTPLLMKAGQQMRIGNSSSDEFMDGIIDDVCIWRTALSADQIKSLNQR